MHMYKTPVSFYLHSGPLFMELSLYGFGVFPTLSAWRSTVSLNRAIFVLFSSRPKTTQSTKLHFPNRILMAWFYLLLF